MKKMIMVLMMVFGLSAGLFAYEPKKECVTVKGNKVQYEETYTEYCCFTNRTYTYTKSWTYNVKTKKVTLSKSGTTKYMWAEVSNCRDAYKACSYLATVYPEHSNALVNFVNEYGDVEETVDGLIEVQSKLAGAEPVDDMSSAAYNRTKAEEWKNKVLNGYPFFTEENWLTLTEEEWLEILSNFCTK